eukprot:1785573-Rhodomonas_salina.1
MSGCQEVRMSVLIYPHWVYRVCDFGSCGFGVSGRDFGVSDRDFGVSGRDFGFSGRDVGGFGPRFQ